MSKFEDIINKINGVSDAVNSASGTAGSLGTTIGSFVGNYQAAKAGEVATARPINDIEVAISEETKIFIYIALGVVGIFVFSKFFKNKKK